MVSSRSSSVNSSRTKINNNSSNNNNVNRFGIYLRNDETIGIKIGNYPIINMEVFSINILKDVLFYIWPIISPNNFQINLIRTMNRRNVEKKIKQLMFKYLRNTGRKRYHGSIF